MNTLKNMKIERSNFSVVKKIWQEKLWPERISPIEPISYINSQGKIDVSLQLGKPAFFVARESELILGVISGYKTAKNEFRSRGIWVDEVYRKLGIGQQLMNQIILQAQSENCQCLWTMPRLSAQNFYLKLGFKEICKVTEYEYGPHIIAWRNVDTENDRH